MNAKTNLVSAGARIAGRHKRYIVWFYLLNLTLASLGAAAFRTRAHAILDQSLYADKLLHGFDLVVLGEMLARPEMGPLSSSAMPALYGALLFFAASVFLMPGVLAGYAAERRLPRDEFFRTCGSNLWRFVRLLLFFAIIAGAIAGLLFGAQSALLKAAEESTNEKLPFYLRISSLAVIVLILTAIRVWFDLAQSDVVLRDQGAVRRSIAATFRHTRRNLGRLLASYVLIGMLALLVLVAGIWAWDVLIPSSSVLGAFLVSQAILLLWLAARFWQRASAVAFYRKHVEEPIMEVQPVPVAAVPVLPTQEGSAV